MKHPRVLISVALSCLLLTTGCAGSVREAETNGPAPSVEADSLVAAESTAEPVTLIGALEVSGTGLRDLEEDVVFEVNGEWLDKREEGSFLSRNFDSEGGQAVFQAMSGDSVEFSPQNLNPFADLTCEIKNEHGVVLATDTVGPADYDDETEKYDIAEADCDIIVP